ncbi:sugar-binding domain-containing protein [Actinobaculum sp. 352]|uniref:sugar-binding transcriptional regulator n=1 Tax=Actinobaculum sp. 352 TaxID=2490946 RepID=UPI000F7F741D|nr:sugar-binding domain-containing protein [Actinobaculum sp. 352]RTE50344.1 hypothetical protein EKN07_03865 [Actinobaculum sp. 352]
MFISPSRIAHMYYEEGKTQQEIANLVGMSRIQISRVLQQARVDGTVRISIDYDGYFPELEGGLSEKYPDVQFVVADSLDGSDAAIKRSIGVTAADYLVHRVPDGVKVAVGWGTTLRELGQRHDAKVKNMIFIPLIGGQVGAGLDVHANSIAELLAQRLGGRALRMFAPAVAETKKIRDQLVASRPLRDTLAEAASAQVALFSVGSPFATTTTIDKIGYFTPDEVEQLRKDGAACDIISLRYYDSVGKECGQKLSSRTVSITAEQLFNIPLKICPAGGEDKHEAIGIALGLGLIDVLVTDDATARFLLA